MEWRFGDKVDSTTNISQRSVASPTDCVMLFYFYIPNLTLPNLTNVSGAMFSMPQPGGQAPRTPLVLLPKFCHQNVRGGPFLGRRQNVALQYCLTSLLFCNLCRMY